MPGALLETYSHDDHLNSMPGASNNGGGSITPIPVSQFRTPDPAHPGYVTNTPADPANKGDQIVPAMKGQEGDYGAMPGAPQGMALARSQDAIGGHPVEGETWKPASDQLNRMRVATRSDVISNNELRQKAGMPPLNGIGRNLPPSQVR